MNEIIQRLNTLWPPTTESLLQLADIALVAFICYKLITLVRSTRAWRLLIGIGVFVLALVLSEIAQLRTLHWVLEKATLLGPVALVILFLPELRQTLEGFARIGEFTERTDRRLTRMTMTTLEEITAAVAELSSTKTGALIVLEQGVHLEDVCLTGVRLDAKITAALLGSIFFDQGPLHDGATIVQGNEIAAAACRLPLSENPKLSSQLHMRHRAAIGITEQSDAWCIVISEERGSISLAHRGIIESFSDAHALRERIRKEMFPESTPSRRRRGSSREEAS